MKGEKFTFEDLRLAGVTLYAVLLKDRCFLPFFKNLSSMCLRCLCVFSFRMFYIQSLGGLSMALHKTGRLQML